MLCLLWAGCKKPLLSKPAIIKLKNLLISDFDALELL
jgi:hypothetical protein